LTITLDQINIAVWETTQFKFDAGFNPQVGQKWGMNLPVHLRGYDYVIDSVEAIQDGYLFKYHSGIDVPQDSLLLTVIGSSPDQDHGNVVRQDSVIEYSKSLTYSAPLPSGQITVELTVIESVPLQGPWTLTWTPPSK
jgi:hypothetical protein